MNANAYDPEAITEFLKRLQQTRDHGYRFIPFIGAGISKPSGYPLMSELRASYLPYCVAKALGIDPFAENAEKDTTGVIWSPRSGVWPDMTSEASMRQTKRVTNEKIRGLLDQIEKTTDSKFDFPPWIAAWAKASLDDWQNTLGFLSQVVSQNTTSAEGKSRKKRIISLNSPDSAVIDSFFHHLNKGRKPTIGHRMLQALADTLPVPVILTTNFDDLLEKSFSVLNSPLEVFSVPSTSFLPDAELVLAQRSLIKMHGSGFGLRTNATLNAPPGLQDTDNFFAYLAGRKLQPGESARQAQFHDSVAILVVGASGEGRIRFFLHRAAETFENLKIFWILHGTKTPELEKLSREFAHKICLASHPHPELLLLELYQFLTGSIPTAGAMFPGIWELPMPPFIGQTGEQTVRNNFNTYLQELSERLCREMSKSEGRTPIVIRIGERNRGGADLAGECFMQIRQALKEKLTIPHYCRPTWIDLDQVGRPAGIFLRLNLLAAKLNGDPDPISHLDINLFDDANCNNYAVEEQEDFLQRFITAMARILRTHYLSPQGGERLLVFLNAQEGCGLDSPFSEPASDLEQQVIHSAKSTRGEEQWLRKPVIDNTLKALDELNRDESCGVQFVIISRAFSAAQKEESIDEKMDAAIAGNTQMLYEQLNNRQWQVIDFAEECSPFHPVRYCDEIIKWIKSEPSEVEARSKFIYLLSLFRHARYPASLIRIVRDLIGSEAQNRVSTWLQQLNRLDVLRFKPGGFIWLHPGIKVLVRKQLLDNALELKFDCKKDAFAIEFHVARWYGRLLLASGDPMSAIESAVHSLHAVHKALEGAGSGIKEFEIGSALEHTIQVIQLAFPLFESRLTDRFARQGLSNLQCRLNDLESDHPQFKPEWKSKLNQLRRIIQLQRSALYMREGDYEKVFLFKNELRTNLHEISTPFYLEQ